jgi:hypothetical protein
LIGVVNAIGLHIERGEDFKPSTHSSLTGRLDTIAPDFCDTRLLRRALLQGEFQERSLGFIAQIMQLDASIKRLCSV